MSKLTAYQAYALFIALKAHFHTEKYDFFKFNGKLKTTREAYDKRTDKSFFEELVHTYNDVDLKNYYVANLISNRPPYVTDLLDDGAVDVYKEYVKRRQSLAYTFTNDLDHLLEVDKPFALSVKQYPPVILLHMRGVITIESMVILDNFIHFIDRFDKYYEDDIIWPKLSLKIRKYKPFLKYDEQRMKAILKERLHEREASKETTTEAASHGTPIRIVESVYEPRR